MTLALHADPDPTKVNVSWAQDGEILAHAQAETAERKTTENGGEVTIVRSPITRLAWRADIAIGTSTDFLDGTLQAQKSSDQRALMQDGAEVAEVLLPGVVRSALDRVRRDLRDRHLVITISLDQRLEQEGFWKVPWELATPSTEVLGRLVLASPSVSLVRAIRENAGTVPALDGPGSLKRALVVQGPDHHGMVRDWGASTEVAALRPATAGGVLVYPQPLNAANLDAISTRLADRWDLFVFVGHGTPNELRLLTVDGDDDVLVGANELADALEGNTRFAILVSCRSGSSSTHTSVGELLARRGVTTVAFQSPLEVQASTPFLHELCSRLAEGEELVVALAGARSALGQSESVLAASARMVIWCAGDRMPEVFSGGWSEVGETPRRELRSEADRTPVERPKLRELVEMAEAADRPGERVEINLIGPSRSGKSTVLRQLEQVPELAARTVVFLRDSALMREDGFADRLLYERIGAAVARQHGVYAAWRDQARVVPREVPAAWWGALVMEAQQMGGGGGPHERRIIVALDDPPASAGELLEMFRQLNHITVVIASEAPREPRLGGHHGEIVLSLDDEQEQTAIVERLVSLAAASGVPGTDEQLRTGAREVVSEWLKMAPTRFPVMSERLEVLRSRMERGSSASVASALAEPPDQPEGATVAAGTGVPTGWVPVLLASGSRVLIGPHRGKIWTQPAPAGAQPPVADVDADVVVSTDGRLAARLDGRSLQLAWIRYSGDLFPWPDTTLSAIDEGEPADLLGVTPVGRAMARIVVRTGTEMCTVLVGDGIERRRDEPSLAGVTEPVVWDGDRWVPDDGAVRVQPQPLLGAVRSDPPA